MKKFIPIWVLAILWLMIFTIPCVGTPALASANGLAAPRATGIPRQNPNGAAVLLNTAGAGMPFVPIDTAHRTPKTIQVGDTIPEWLWHLPLPYWNGPTTEATLTLSDYGDRKLILLDFWTSYCSSCLGGFRLLDSLQRIHQRDLQVVLLNPAPAKDTPRRITQAFAKHLSIPLDMPIAFPDTEVYRHFDIPGVPHYVWIDGDRVIRAVTKRKAVTTEAIHAFITRQQP